MGSEAIDVSARQFEASADFPRRSDFQVLAAPYGEKRRVNFDNDWDMKFVDHIPANWRDLREPPGEAEGWPYDQ